MIQRELYGFGAFVLDSEQMILRGERGIVSLPPKAVLTLLALLERRGEVVSKQQLMDRLWPDTFVEEGNLTQNIFLLRKELGKTPEGEDYIQTLPKRGYRIAVDVVEMERPGTAEFNAPKLMPEPRSADAPSGKSEIQSAEENFKNAADRKPQTGRRFAAMGAVAVLIICALSGWTWHEEATRPWVGGYARITQDGAVKRGHLVTEGGPDAALFTDGVRVYFTEGSTDAPVLAEVSALGGETAHISVPFAQPQLLDLSRGRSELLVSGEVNPSLLPPLWTIPVPGGTARTLAVAARDGSWSPDGHMLAFLQGADLYLAKGDGSDAKKLLSLPGPGWMPRWSPDGALIRLSVFDTRGSGTSLWEMKRDGSGLHRLLEGWNSKDGPTSVCCGSWTPDGRDFIFQANRLGRSEIWEMPAESSWLRRTMARFDLALNEPVQLTSGQLSSLAPALSPDGKKLFVIGQQLRSALERYDSRTGQFVAYKPETLGNVSADFVDVSPDGQWLAYVDYPDGNLWRCRMNGSERLQLTSPPMMAMVPIWSPDGKQILFYGYNSGSQQQGYIVSAQGGKAQPIQPGGGGQMQSNWSPDGKSVMYSDFPFFVRDPSAIGVHVVDLQTQRIETLPRSTGFFGGTWSPDGSHAAAWGADGESLMIYDFKTKSWTKAGLGGGFVKWSRDGSALYYLRLGVDSAVMRMRLKDHRVEEVASLKGIRLAGRLAGIAFALTPQDEPLVLRDVGTQEVYSLDWHER